MYLSSKSSAITKFIGRDLTIEEFFITCLSAKPCNVLTIGLVSTDLYFAFTFFRISAVAERVNVRIKILLGEYPKTLFAYSIKPIIVSDFPVPGPATSNLFNSFPSTAFFCSSVSAISFLLFGKALIVRSVLLTYNMVSLKSVVNRGFTANLRDIQAARIPQTEEAHQWKV